MIEKKPLSEREKREAKKARRLARKRTVAALSPRDGTVEGDAKRIAELSKLRDRFFAGLIRREVVRRNAEPIGELVAAQRIGPLETGSRPRDITLGRAARRVVDSVFGE